MIQVAEFFSKIKKQGGRMIITAPRVNETGSCWLIDKHVTQDYCCVFFLSKKFIHNDRTTRVDHLSGLLMITKSYIN